MPRRAPTPRACGYVAGDILTADVGRPFDLVTCVATLHHLPLREGLTRLRELTAPGGTLVVVGLADRSSPGDVAMGALGLVAARWARPRRGEWDARVPLVDVSPPLGDVRAAARELLPGSRLRRRLYWRYSLVWTAPA